MKRIVELDALRGLAILGVIGIHASIYILPYYAIFWPQGPSVVYLNQLFRFATPLLLFLSGITLTLSQLHRPLPLLQFYKRRFIKVLWPYVVWSILFTIINRTGQEPNLLQTAWQNIFTGKSDYHMYFVLLLIQCYILFPFCYRWLARLPNKQKVSLASVLVLSQTLLLFFYMHARLNRQGPTEDTAFRFFVFWIAYFLLGMLFGLSYEASIKKIARYPITVLGILTLGFAGILTFETSRYVTLPFYDALNFFRPSVFLYAIVSGVFLIKSALFLTQHASTIAQRINSVLHLTGRHSLGIYFCHTIFLRLFMQNGIWADLPHAIAVIALLLLTLLASLLAVILFDRVIKITWRQMLLPAITS